MNYTITVIAKSTKFRKQQVKTATCDRDQALNLVIRAVIAVSNCDLTADTKAHDLMAMVDSGAVATIENPKQDTLMSIQAVEEREIAC